MAEPTRGEWLAGYAMLRSKGQGFTTPEIEEERYQTDVRRGNLLPDMTVDELKAAFLDGKSMVQILNSRILRNV